LSDHYGEKKNFLPYRRSNRGPSNVRLTAEPVHRLRFSVSFYKASTNNAYDKASCILISIKLTMEYHWGMHLQMRYEIRMSCLWT
jgi:hypothetical protein